MISRDVEIVKDIDLDHMTVIDGDLVQDHLKAGDDHVLLIMIEGGDLDQNHMIIKGVIDRGRALDLVQDQMVE